MRAPQQVGAGRPTGVPGRLTSCRDRAGRQDRDERGEFLGGSLATDDAQDRHCRRVGPAHSGMFPCFLGGNVCRLPASRRSALAISRRVCDGSMTASTKPRSAAM